MFRISSRATGFGFRILVTLAACASLALAANEGGIERVFVVTCSHLDIGFTGTPEAVALGYKDNLDHAIALCEAETDFKWTIETSWQLVQWLRRTPDAKERQRLAQLIRSGRMELGAMPATFHSAVLSAEEI